MCGTSSKVGSNSNMKIKSDDRMEQLQADHEVFLQTFEKPTQIYRYLRTRNMISPIFLNRNLTFMRGRMSRNNSKRANFKVDSLYKMREQKKVLSLTFLGLYDSRRSTKTQEQVKIELVLVKDTTASQKCVGSCEIPFNPPIGQPPSISSAISIPPEAFSYGSDDQQEAQSTLIVRVRPATSKHAQCNGNKSEDLEPSAKRRKRSSMEVRKMLSAQMCVYTTKGLCLLTDGDYELVLKPTPLDDTCPEESGSSWENVDLEMEDLNPGDLEIFERSPTLKFRVSWTQDLAGPLEPPCLLKPRSNGIREPLESAKGKEKLNNKCGKGPKNGSVKKTEKKTKIVYQFICNNNYRQQTEASADMICPWCFLNCIELYALLKHLKLSHPRFLFTYVPTEEGARIDVSVSELFDSTYAGNPHDLISQPPGFAFSRTTSGQRTPSTNILVCKPKRPAKSLSEFLEVEGDNDLNGPYVDGQRPFVTGHNRLYHYATTNLPMPPHAILQDGSEDQVDPPWLIKKTCRMIDEFTDVNAGEKDFMKMWNLHVQHYTYVGDCQMNLALKMFVEEKGKEIVEKNLYRNFVLHCCNLFDFGVLGPGSVFLAISRMQQFLQESGESLATNWTQQRSTWMTQHDLKPRLPTANEDRKDFSGLFKSEAPLVEMKSLIASPATSNAASTPPKASRVSELAKEQ